MDGQVIAFIDFYKRSEGGHEDKVMADKQVQQTIFFTRQIPWLSSVCKRRFPNSVTLGAGESYFGLCICTQTPLGCSSFQRPQRASCLGRAELLCSQPLIDSSKMGTSSLTRVRPTTG